MIKLITVSGPPSSGKTSVLTHVLRTITGRNIKAGVVKFDCLSTTDDQVYDKYDIPVRVGLSGSLCPDHYFVNNIEDCLNWGKSEGLDYLFSESAGLCNRCSPHLKKVMAVCVIYTLRGSNTP